MNPGSKEAYEAGCLCPWMDNNRGLYPPYPPDGWVVNLTCPIHGQAELPLEDDDGPQGPAD